MTIKEAESLTGLPRASIRFYEAEGFIAPEREKNSYRIYSQEDIDTLLRVKLLRALGIPLEDIRAAAQGSTPLEFCIRRRAEQIREDTLRAERVQMVCRALVETGTEFSSLEAEKYLQLLEADAPPSPAGQKDSVQSPRLWRRVLARSLDHSLYLLPWQLMLVLLFRINFNAPRNDWQNIGLSLLQAVGMMALLLFAEPLLLSRWGTTPGKWLMGISVTGDNGKKLTYRAALTRSWELLLYGFGLFLPIISLVREIKSLRQLHQGEEPYWQWNSQLRLEGKHWERAAVYVLCALLLVQTEEVVFTFAGIPPNRGDITVAEFAENYNTLQKYFERGTKDYIVHTLSLEDSSARVPWRLDKEGHWVSREDKDFFPYVNSPHPPEISFVITDEGYIRELRFAYTGTWTSGDRNQDDDIFGASLERHIFQMRIAALALVGAQKEFGIATGSRDTLTELVLNWTEDYAFTLRGASVHYDVEFTNCAPENPNWPWMTETEGETEHAVHYSFSIQLAQ